MVHDSQYAQSQFKLAERSHQYGKNVHLIEDPSLFSLLAILSQEGCRHPLFNRYLTLLYRGLLQSVLNQEFPKTKVAIRTRMSVQHPEEGEFEAEVIDPQTKVVCVSLARAGMIPSQICFDELNYLINSEIVRQDHISINRKTNEQSQVVGTELGGVKIGGDIQNSIVLIPDPMGATGSTIARALDIYKELGTARKVIAMHLIVTPEYLATAKARFPQVQVYALRLDRGLSSEAIFNTPLGSRWADEKGLNENHYIVPGAGGIGELINNSFV